MLRRVKTSLGPENLTRLCALLPASTPHVPRGEKSAGWRVFDTAGALRGSPGVPESHGAAPTIMHRQEWDRNGGRRALGAQQGHGLGQRPARPHLLAADGGGGQRSRSRGLGRLSPARARTISPQKVLPIALRGESVHTDMLAPLIGGFVMRNILIMNPSTAMRLIMRLIAKAL